MEGNAGFEFYSWVKPLPAYASTRLRDFSISTKGKVSNKNRSEAGSFDPARVCEVLDQETLEQWGVIDAGLERTGGFSMLGEDEAAPEITSVFHVGLDLLEVARKKFGNVHVHEFVFVFAFADSADALPKYLCRTEVRFVDDRDERSHRYRLLTPEGKARLVDALGKKVSTPKALGDAWVVIS